MSKSSNPVANDTKKEEDEEERDLLRPREREREKIKKNETKKRKKKKKHLVGAMFQVTCIRGKQRARVRLVRVAARQRLRTTVIQVTLEVTRTPRIHNVRTRVGKATKVGMPPAPLNLASKALISKSGPPHDHFN